jgi:SAM-dependent methyltransferase
MSRLITPPPPPDCDRLWRDIYGDLQRFGPAHFHERRLVRRLLEPLEYRSLLDVGCGPGWNTRQIAGERRLTDVLGVDLSEVAVAEARARCPGLEFEVHDLQRSAPAGRWDLVHCSLVLHLIPDDRAALRHLRMCSRRYLMISTMAGDFERHRAWETHLGAVRNYRRGELEGLLIEAGFAIRRAIYWGFPFYSPLGRELQDFTGVGTGRYGWSTRLIASALRGLFHLNSASRGDLLVILAEVPADAAAPSAGATA